MPHSKRNIRVAGAAARTPWPGGKPRRTTGRVDRTHCVHYNSFMKSPAETAAFLTRVARALAADRVRITWKADDELGELGWSHDDALYQLAALVSDDLLDTEPSRHPDFTLIWVFCPPLPDDDDGSFLWIRLAERTDETFIVSFHLAQGDPWR